MLIIPNEILNTPIEDYDEPSQEMIKACSRLWYALVESKQVEPVHIGTITVRVPRNCPPPSTQEEVERFVHENVSTEEMPDEVAQRIGLMRIVAAYMAHQWLIYKGYVPRDATPTMVTQGVCNCFKSMFGNTVQ